MFKNFVKLTAIMVIIITVIILTFYRYSIPIHDVKDISSVGELSLKDWRVLVIKSINKEDQNLDSDYLLQYKIQNESEFSQNLSFSLIDDLKNLLYKNLYIFTIEKSKESIIDLDNLVDPNLYNSAIYMFCEIKSESQQNVFLMNRSTNGIKLWVNGQVIIKTKEKRGFEQYFSDYARVNLKKGTNKILIKRIIQNSNLLIETKIGNFSSTVDEYRKSANGIVLDRGIIQDSIKLRENTSKCFGLPIEYSIKNTENKTVYSFKENTRSSNFTMAHNMNSESSYVCSFQIGGFRISQPIFKGNPDLYLKKLKSSSNFSELSIHSYVYRLQELLKHESRSDDWWWSFKVASVIYEIEILKSNIRNNITTGIQYKSYRSVLDGSLQHYLLITPDSLSESTKTPLVLVIRPFIENYHHFLTSPQVARHWGLLWAKNLANKYKYTILMPCARLYKDEPMLPIAEAEVFQAISDVKKHYCIDDTKVYLHGNCSAGYRCLLLAQHYPHAFAALGLYAPMTKVPIDNEWLDKNSPNNNIPCLKNTPVIIHYDSTDLHSPYSEFKMFIEKCINEKVPLKISEKKHSEVHYNVQIVGEETFQFFKKIKRNKSNFSRGFFYKKPAIINFFSSPFMFVGTKNENTVINDIKTEYKKLLYSKLPFKYEDEVTIKDMKTKNIFYIGHNFSNKLIKNQVKSVSLVIDSTAVKINDQEFLGNNITFQAMFDNPYAHDKKVIIYSTNSKILQHLIQSPWKSGFENQVILKK